MSVPASRGTSPTALIFIGTRGAGRKTLFSQLGWSFEPPVNFVEGAFVIQEESEQTVTLNGKELILMNTSGLYERGEEASRLNTERLTRALERGYNYKIFFVLKANFRGLASEDLALMSAVNRCVRQADGAKVEFGIIVNQIERDAVYYMYKEGLTTENLRNFESYELDIEVNSVLLGWFDGMTDLAERLRGVISKPFKGVTPVKINPPVKIDPPVKINPPIKINPPGPTVAQNKDKDMFGFPTVTTTIALVVIGAIIAVCRK
ncbi:hypothetical protein BGX34_010053 [Mortierella sp. NVP85]|nr:hypothetical protein BGX34_010053 [Mortierella sp. NVP85]